MPFRMFSVEARPLHPHINQSLDESCPQGKAILLGELAALAKGITEEVHLHKLLAGNSL